MVAAQQPQSNISFPESAGAIRQVVCSEDGRCIAALSAADKNMILIQDIASSSNSSFSVSDAIQEIAHLTATDILLVTVTGSVQLISLENQAHNIIARTDTQRQIELVKSNGGDKVFIYDSEQILSLWNPHTNQIVSTSLVRNVKGIEYSPEDDILFVLSHNGG